MAFGTRFGVLAKRFGSALEDGAAQGEGASRIGATLFNTAKDTLFTGVKTEEDATGATMTSRIAGGVIGVGAVAGVGAAAQQAQDHPILGIGAMGATAALLASRPKTVMEAIGGAGERMAGFGTKASNTFKKSGLGNVNAEDFNAGNLPL